MEAESPHIDVRTVLIEDARALHELDYSFETDRIYTLRVRGRLAPAADSDLYSQANPALTFELFETPVDPPFYKSYRAFERTLADVEASLRGVEGGYVALANGQVAGVILLNVEEWRSVARIEHIIVGRQFRRYGIGSLLLSCASDWARNHHCWAILLETQNVNYPAIQFYLRNGLEELETQNVNYPAIQFYLRNGLEELETQNVNYPAIQFYLRNGLEVWSISQQYYPPGPVEHEIAIFMGKKLWSAR